MPKYQKSTDVERLLYTRRQVAQALGDVDVSYVRNLEEKGLLKGIRLTPNGQIFHARDDVLKLIAHARGEAPAEEVAS